MPLVLRTEKGSPLTYNEMDGNLQFLYSQSASGSGGGMPGGSDQQIQFNRASAFDGSYTFIFNYESSSLGQGRATNPVGYFSHAEGRSTTAQGNYSHAEGLSTTAQGDYSHAEGLGTISSGSYSHTVGMYNDPISDPGAFVVGNGSGETGRSNLIIASSQSGFVVPLVAPPAPMTGSMYLDLNTSASIKFWNGSTWILYSPSNQLPQTLTDSATVVWDFNSGYNAKITLGGDRTLSITNINPGDVGVIKIIQDGVGGRTLTLPSGSKVANNGGGILTLASASNSINCASVYYDGEDFLWTISTDFS